MRLESKDSGLVLIQSSNKAERMGTFSNFISQLILLKFGVIKN
jgi:hypothetical protein